jgi:hypothetical protein
MTQHRLSFVPPYRASGYVPARSYQQHRASLTPEDERRISLQVKLGPYRSPKRKSLVSLAPVNWLDRKEV